MHRDPPPGLFDARRPSAHVVSAGLIAGFFFAVVTQFSWNLWQQSSGTTPLRSPGSDALVRGIQGDKPVSSATPAPALRY